MDEDEFFDFESALTNEITETLRRFTLQNPGISDEHMVLLHLTSACRIFVSIGINSELPEKLCYDLFDCMFKDVKNLKKDNNV